MTEHEFTKTIIDIIEDELKIDGRELLQISPLLEYINIKTRSANRGSKSRGSFANLYAIYVLVEDYIKIVFDKKQDYRKYEGAVFSDLFERQRQLPFGEKLNYLTRRLYEKEIIPQIHSCIFKHHFFNCNFSGGWFCWNSLYQ